METVLKPTDLGRILSRMADPSKTIKFLYLSMDDVLKVGLTMAEVMDLCSVSLTEHNLGRVENPPKPGVHPLPDAFIHAMPGISSLLYSF